MGSNYQNKVLDHLKQEDGFILNHFLIKMLLHQKMTRTDSKVFFDNKTIYNSLKLPPKSEWYMTCPSTKTGYEYRALNRNMTHRERI